MTATPKTADIRALERCSRRFPLPLGWTLEPWSDVVHIGDLVLHAVGIAAQGSGGQMLTGSAVGLRGSPVARAYFELLERLSALEAVTEALADLPTLDRLRRRVGSAPSERVFLQSARPEWRFSVSNGIAVHRSWSQAAAHAHFELVERDRVLRSWYGQTTPRRIEGPKRAVRERLRGLYALEAYEFDASSAGATVGVLAFPERDTAPLTYGFAARGSKSQALERALAECLQRLAFLWGEEIPGEPPRPEATADFHQEHYLCRQSHAQLRAWLRGEHRRIGVGRPRGRRRQRRFVDLTPPWLKGAVVVKALPNDELPLVFGRGSPVVEEELPDAMAVHPIV